MIYIVLRLYLYTKPFFISNIQKKTLSTSHQALVVMLSSKLATNSRCLTSDLADGDLDAAGDSLAACLGGDVIDTIHQCCDVERLELTGLDGVLSLCSPVSESSLKERCKYGVNLPLMLWGLARARRGRARIARENCILMVCFEGRFLERY